jgi:hypothetical protein
LFEFGILDAFLETEAWMVYLCMGVCSSLLEWGMYREGRRTHHGSTISNISGSVMRSQTSYAFVRLNSEIHNMLKSCIVIESPPAHVLMIAQKVSEREDAPDPSLITTPLPSPLARKSAYISQTPVRLRHIPRTTGCQQRDA